ncbi:hypothetical protein SDC9_195907 [bioreactor metagenome]|uniref:Uncharacterized protein n=1 Tax=bioreactor metagenome TaxID=1076179 RepID=A0A645IB01_9ZZZZ
MKRQSISGEGLLQQGVADVFFVGENILDCRVMPSGLAVLTGNFFFCKFIGDGIHAFAGQIATENPANDRSFLLIWDQNIIDQLISIGSVACDKIPALHPAQITPTHIVGD